MNNNNALRLSEALRYSSFLFFLFIIASPAFSDTRIIPEGIYEYVYEYNSERLIENHYIKIFYKKGKAQGIYYGTSDDFDEAREGYLPGFFSSKMNSIKVDGAKISFSIKPDVFYRQAVTPAKKNKSNSAWKNLITTDIRTYHATYKDNRLFVTSSGLDDRVFNKIK
ncbi:hypothetical protein MNBD_GAMMA10-1475 [hydrothermal vent metagenome]|uniref:Uncharacterized protein n=1 Tax=hydrothermal vent metagenome TaxID=652676 RepID=A0A3B0XP87_9ZZZZ